MRTFLNDTDKTPKFHKHSEKLNQFWASSDEMCLELAEKYDNVLLSFSLGKDSIAAATQALKYFKRVEFVYMYDVPHLEFIDKSIEYFNKFFGKEILQVPAPSFLNRTFHLHFNPRKMRIDRRLLFTLF